MIRPRVHRRVHGEILMRTEIVSSLVSWSGRGDLNARPPAPKAGALPGCATPRLNSFYTTSEAGRSARTPSFDPPWPKARTRITTACQGRMKIPQIAGRKFPTPHQVVVDANRHFSEHG